MVTCLQRLVKTTFTEICHSKGQHIHSETQAKIYFHSVFRKLDLIFRTAEK